MIGAGARIGALLMIAGCQALPYGEVLIVADTDVSVPDQVAALQIDLFDENGVWFESRLATTLQRESWPVSFALTTDGNLPKRARVRLRAYPDGRVSDYHGGAWAPPPPYVEPWSPTSTAELCSNTPELPANTEVTLRHERGVFTAADPAPGCGQVYSAAAARTIVITQADQYHFEVVRVFPDPVLGQYASNTLLWLRQYCPDGPQLACNDDLDAANGNRLSGFDVTLMPGSYTLLVGGGTATPADVTLKWARTAEWSAAPPDAGAPPPDAGPGRRLIVDGNDVTPPTEPQPGVTIDRLFDVEVTPGTRRTAGVLLTGECFGTAADLDGARSCTDTAGQLDPVAPVALTDGIDRGGPTRAGSWAAAQPVPCTAEPRPAGSAADGTPLLDEEVCVPGGAFRLGDADTLGALIGPHPEQMAVVEPFLMDRYEVTVGRYRAALAAGFDPPQYTFQDPYPNLGPLVYTSDTVQRCTFSGDASGPARGIDRERFPLLCVTWYTARLFCQSLGGDLPTLAQWEFAARMAGKRSESIYPWGDGAPTCDLAYYDHGPLGACPKTGAAVAVDAEPWALNDRTPAGVVGLAGSVAEWVLDSGRPYADPCWWQKPLRGVGCFENAAPLRFEKGAFYAEAEAALRSAQTSRDVPGIGTTGGGFRCVRPGR
jgi:formylglycine-generating enzyme required for sulfatase activity